MCYNKDERSYRQVLSSRGGEHLVCKPCKAHQINWSIPAKATNLKQVVLAARGLNSLHLVTGRQLIHNVTPTPPRWGPPRCADHKWTASTQGLQALLLALLLPHTSCKNLAKLFTKSVTSHASGYSSKATNADFALFGKPCFLTKRICFKFLF